MDRTGHSRLIAVRLPPEDAVNVLWARERKLPARWRWAIRVLGGDGQMGKVAELSDRLFPSYSKAVNAIIKHEEHYDRHRSSSSR